MVGLFAQILLVGFGFVSTLLFYLFLSLKGKYLIRL